MYNRARTIEARWEQAAVAAGDKKIRAPRHEEEEEMQEECVMWFNARFPRFKIFLHHSPNGGNRSKREGGKFKAMGTRRGFPDLIWLVPRLNKEKFRVIPYTMIEMKTKTGKQSPEQKQYEESCEMTGAEYMICRSKLEFMKIILKFMEELMEKTKQLERNRLEESYMLTPLEKKMTNAIAKEIATAEEEQRWLDSLRAKAKAAKETRDS